MQIAADTLGEVSEFDGAAELVGDQITDYGGAEPASGRLHHGWPPLSCQRKLSPFLRVPHT